MKPASALLAGIAALSLLPGCAPDTGPSTGSQADQADALIGVWEVSERMNGRFFGGTALIDAGTLRFGDDGSYQASFEIDVDTTHGNITLRAVTTSQWSRHGDRVRFDGGDTRFELIDYQVPGVSDAEMYAEVDRWAAAQQGRPHASELRIRSVTDSTLVLYDGDVPQTFRKVS